LVVLIALFLAPPCSSADSLPLDLQSALERARSDNQLLEASRLRIEEARGDLLGASVLLVDNPEVFSNAGPRTPAESGSSRTTDYQIGIEQRFEIARQRHHRVTGARSELSAAEASWKDAGRALELAVATVFYDALAARRRTGIAAEREAVARRLYEVATLRLDRGEATHLESNAARIRLGEAERRLTAARAVEQSARIRLAELLSLAPATELRLEGALPATEVALLLQSLVDRALAERPDLVAIGDEVDAADANVRLAEAEAWPDITVGVSYGEDERDDVLRGRVRVPIPLFNRNQGPRHRARAEARRLRAERHALRLTVESEVRRLYADYEQGREALQHYDSDLLKAHQESLELLERAFAAGQVGYSEVIIVQREVLEGLEGHLDAQLAFARARAALLAASGGSVSEPTQESQP